MKSFKADYNTEMEDEKVVQTRIATSVINKLKRMAPQEMSYNKKIRCIVETLINSGTPMVFDFKRRRGR